MSQSLSDHSQKVFLVEDAVVITAPVVSFLYVLPGWKANVVPRGRGSVVALSRKGNAGEKYVKANGVRDAFEKIETIDDAASFFEKYGSATRMTTAAFSWASKASPERRRLIRTP